MKKTVKLLTVLLIAITLITFVANISNAAELLTPDQIDAKQASSTGNTEALVGKANNIAGMIRNIAVIASVIILMVLGVKNMLGSVEEKAEYKKSFMPLIIGIILVVSATTIASFIFNMAK